MTTLCERAMFHHTQGDAIATAETESIVQSLLNAKMEYKQAKTEADRNIAHLRVQEIQREVVHVFGPAATKYVIMRMILEQRTIATLFPNHIFHSYTSRDEAMLLPDLPKIYLWSTKA